MLSDGIKKDLEDIFSNRDIVMDEDDLVMAKDMINHSMLIEEIKRDLEKMQVKHFQKSSKFWNVMSKKYNFDSLKYKYDVGLCKGNLIIREELK